LVVVLDAQSAGIAHQELGGLLGFEVQSLSALQLRLLGRLMIQRVLDPAQIRSFQMQPNRRKLGGR